MASVTEHYDALLAPIYLWMAGGLDRALEAGARDLAGVLGDGGLAVDLGAGFGMHAIPLARAGYRVLAIDSSALLLEELRRHSEGLDVRAVVADLRRFREHVSEPADVVVCMGDTLTHLDDEADVEALMRDVAERLRPGGRFVATFRDYTRLATGTSRFIPVRSDESRILTCFLEEEPRHVVVHDVVHERGADGWSTRVGSYRKLRLSPDAVVRYARAARLEGAVGPGPRGMVRLVAERPGSAP